MNLTDDGRSPPLAEPSSTPATLTERGPARLGVSLPVGSTVAERFLIVRAIASGGMGSVYEAEDRALGERIALKTLRGDRRGDHSIERFMREISLARRVTHPNVCRTFDLFVHPRQPGGEEVLFVTMELLPGETLADRLRDHGPLRANEALAIAMQVCAGLDAAHRAGVVHRDLKSANIMLVPTASGERPRAVITDFGIARGLEVGAGDGLTERGQFLGTPDYVSPEQLRGEEVDRATDIYSLGVVLFETVTGRRPFLGDNPVSSAIKRLEEDPPSVDTLCPDLDPRWAVTVRRCLARRAEDRFPTAAAVADALSGSPPVRAGARRRIVRTATGVLLALAMLIALPRHVEDGSAPSAERAATARAELRPRVGLLGIAGPADDEPWLAVALEELVATELRAAGSLVVATGREEREAGRVLPVPLPAAAIPAVATSRGWDVVIQGRYAIAQGELRLELSAAEPERGDAIFAVSASGAPDRLHRVAEQAGQDLVRTLAGRRETPNSAVLGPLRPTSPQAARAYAEGIDALRRHDPTLARERLLQAVDADAGFSLAWLALARAWGASGYDDRARSAADRAEALSAELPREQRLAIEGERHRLARDWQRAEEIYRALATFFPDNPEYALELARVQNVAGRPRAARETIAGLRASARSSIDPRIDLVEAEALLRLDDYPGAAERAQHAMAAAEAQGSPLLGARAERLLAQVRRRQGDGETALAFYRSAREKLAAAGDANGVAATLVSEAIIRRLRGDRETAETLYDRALSFYLQAGNLEGQATVMLNRANLRLEDGRTDDAIGLYRRCLEVYGELGQRDSIALAASNLGSALSDAGRVDEAIEPLERALATYRALGSAVGEGTASINLGDAFLQQSRREEARSAFDRALEIFETAGDEYGRAIAINNLGRHARAVDDLSGARARHDEALVIFRRLEVPAMEAHALFDLGEVARAERDLAGAEAYHRRALAIRQRLDLTLDVEQSRKALAQLGVQQRP